MTTSMRLLATFLMAATLSACGGGGGSGPSGTPPPSPPVAKATATGTSGVAPLSVSFDATGSSDPQGYALTFTWDFGDGSTGSGSTIQHSYQKHGTYSATVAVNDSHNTTTSSAIAVAVTAAAPTTSNTSATLNVWGVAASSVTGQITASDRESLPLSYSVATQATSGTASITSFGQYTYSVPGHVTTASGTFTVQVSNGLTTANATVQVALNYDPLLVNQWHIQNTGQDAFASTRPVAGNDMNVAGAWAAGYSGKGIKVGVVDSGLEAAHEDLAGNFDLAHSLNFLDGTHDPSPTGTGFDHGTAVAGIIGAVAFNGKGGRGVAYNATLRGYNLIAPGAGSIVNMASSLGGDVTSADSDLFNASFGLVSNALQPFSGSFQSITGTTVTLRTGKGAVIVNAAGNDFADIEGASSPLCVVSRQYGVSCGDPATDERRGGTVPLIVGALNAAGAHSSYSNAGSSLWVTAPGGEFGLNSTYFTGASNYDPAIITTSRGGCTNTEYPTAVNPLDNLGANPLAANCQYTATMNGTSSATPNVSGVVAMMLEANPNLSYRDIKYILAKTAKRVDPSFIGITATDIIVGSTITLEQGWTTNAAGYAFSNRYGFGSVDAAAAVAMAKTYATYLPAQVGSTGTYQFTAAAPGTITAGAAGNYLTWTVSESFASVEGVVIFLNIATTPGLPCNQVELVSPAGTRSILLHAANGFTNASVVNSRIESNAFYGESPNGVWTLKFFDFCPGASTATTLSSTLPQVLLLAGH